MVNKHFQTLSTTHIKEGYTYKYADFFNDGTFLKFEVLEEGQTFLTLSSYYHTAIYAYRSYKMMLFKVDGKNSENLSYVTTKVGHWLRDITMEFEAECSEYVVFIYKTIPYSIANISFQLGLYNA
jgi:hypothetical protein